MLEGKLEKDIISQPELWRLVLMISANGLSVALYPPVAREEIIWRKFDFDPAAPDRLKAVEDIIYDNPLLLCDFKRIECIIDSGKYLVLPQESNPGDYASLLKASSIDNDEDNLLMSCAAANAIVLQALDKEVTQFLKRTFFNINFSSKISMVASYFASHSEGMPSRRVFALIEDKRLTFIALDNQNLLAANEFNFQRLTDAAYYVLAAMKQVGFDPANPEIALATYRDMSDDEISLSTLLKPYIRTLRTVPFPMLRYRASRNTLLTPFPLLILPICE